MEEQETEVGKTSSPEGPITNWKQAAWYGFGLGFKWVNRIVVPLLVLLLILFLGGFVWMFFSHWRLGYWEGFDQVVWRAVQALGLIPAIYAMFLIFVCLPSALLAVVSTKRQNPPKESTSEPLNDR